MFDISKFKRDSEAFRTKLQVFKGPFSQKGLKTKKANQNIHVYRSLSMKPWSHVRILMYRKRAYRIQVYVRKTFLMSILQ